MSEDINTDQLKIDVDNYEERLLKNKCSGIYNIVFKRLIGLIIALILFVLLSPVLLIISIIIIVNSGFPIFYKGERGGYNNKSFKIYKFRSMVNNADKLGGGTTALNDNRITKIGKFLRKTKLDEIPQLINIIKGEMSFIGPRPELIKYTSQYEGNEEFILKVRPGITDFSSIEFISLDELVGGDNADEMYENCVLKRKNYLRVKYVESITFGVDFKIFFNTVVKTIKKAMRTIFKERLDNGKSITKEL